MVRYFIMNLEILSHGEALKYVPKDETYALRISNGMNWFLPDLKQSDYWVDTRGYSFDDIWPKSWKEYSWLDFNSPSFDSIFKRSWRELQSEPMTEKSFRSYIEHKGHHEGRVTLFAKEDAIELLKDYDSFGKDAKTIMIHCDRGKNRSPAVGIAMNEIYGWGIKGLKEKHPAFRRYIYQTLLDVS